MCDMLRGWYPPTSKEYERLWDEDLIVLDASVLLTLYRYGDRVRSEFLDTLEQFTERLSVPYQAALEYQRNRLGVIEDQHNAYNRLRSDLNQVVDRVSGAVGAFARHPRLEVAQITREFDSALARALSYLSSVEAKDLEGDSDQGPSEKDTIRDRLTLLLAGRVGASFADAEVFAIEKEGELRYAKSIPPGYRDREKPDDRRYGDLLVWRQILKRASDGNPDVIYVTDDRKDDWWWIERGKTIGPRPELIDEFSRQSDGVFYMYTPDVFLGRAGVYLGRTLSDEVVGEVQEVARQRARRRRGQSPRTIRHIALLEDEKRDVLEEIARLRAADSRVRSSLVNERRSELRRTGEQQREKALWRIDRLLAELSATPDGNAVRDEDFLREQLALAEHSLYTLDEELGLSEQMGPGAVEEQVREILQSLEARVVDYDSELAHLKQSARDD